MFTIVLVLRWTFRKRFPKNIVHQWPEDGSDFLRQLLTTMTTTTSTGAAKGGIGEVCKGGGAGGVAYHISTPILPKNLILMRHHSIGMRTT